MDLTHQGKRSLFPIMLQSMITIHSSFTSSTCSKCGLIAPMKLDQTIDLVFTAQLQPSAPARFIHFVRPVSSKGKSLFTINNNIAIIQEVWV